MVQVTESCHYFGLDIKYLQNIVTVSKLVGVLIVIVGGILRLFQGHTDSFSTGKMMIRHYDIENNPIVSGFSKLDFLKPIGPASIGLIAFNGLWNFDGWNQLNFVAEEIRDPMKNLPRSILFSMPVVVVVYVLMNVSYLTVLSPEALYNSDSVAVVSDLSRHLTPLTDWTCRTGPVLCWAPPGVGLFLSSSQSRPSGPFTPPCSPPGGRCTRPAGRDTSQPSSPTSTGSPSPRSPACSSPPAWGSSSSC